MYTIRLQPHSCWDWTMKATPRCAHVQVGTLLLSSVRISTSVTSSLLEELRYNGNAVHGQAGLSPLNLHLSREGGMFVFNSSHRSRAADVVVEVEEHLAPSSSSPSTMASCTPSALSHPISRYSSRSSRLHL